MLCIKVFINILLTIITSSHAQSQFSTRSRIHESSPLAGSLIFATKYEFSGVSGQFTEFPVWLSPLSKTPTGSKAATTLSFEFQTLNSQSFLVYLDDGGDTSFISLTLLHGEVNLRFRFGKPKTVILRAGTNLNDNEWHTVILERNFPSMTLTVDGNSTTSSVTGAGASKFVPLTNTYFGGLPRTYRVQLLSLPGVYSRSKFIGKMGSIRMNGNFVTHLKKSRVQEMNADVLCSIYRNPCMNNGICFVNSKKKAECDCSPTKFTGDYCDTARETTSEPAPSEEASFRGSQWLSFDLTSNPVSSMADEIKLSFRTRYPDGLLLHTGKSADYVALSLENGNIVLVVNLGSGAYEIVVEPERGGFDDGKWHYVRMNRTLQRVDIVVDQANIRNKYIQEDFSQLTLDDNIYVGGSPSTINLPGLKSKSNFIGCLREVVYNNTKFRRIPISHWAHNRDERIAVHGDVDFVCMDPDAYGPVRFTTPASWLLISTTNDVRKCSIEFTFRTSEPSGLILYSNSTASDLLAIEMYKGDVYVVVNLGSGTSRFRITTSQKLGNGKWHRLSLVRYSKDLTVVVDGTEQTWEISGPNSNLDLSKNLFLGGTDFGDRFHPSAGLWTAPLRQGFVGCIRDFQKDGDNIDIQSLARSRSTASESPNDVTPLCNGIGKSYCSSFPCKNNGVCTEGMDRFICDCSNTSYMGVTCENAVVTSRFNGSQMITFPMERTKQTDGEEISLRFKTPVSTGILFATTSNSSKDNLRIELLKGGKIQLLVNIGQGPDILLEGSGLSDRQWHRVKVSRRGLRVSLDVDGRRKGKTLSGVHSKLEFDVIHLGRIVTSPQNTINSSSSRILGLLRKPFIGHLENVVFNTVHLIDSCVDGSLACNNNSSFGDTTDVVSFPASFEDDDSYVVLPTLQAYNSMELFLSLKTTVKDGLILFNSGRNGDFIAIEMVEGKVFYLYNIGNGDQVLSVPGATTVNDNNWHDVRIVRNENNVHTMMVDGVAAYNTGSRERVNLDLDGNLFIGGVRQDMFRRDFLPSDIASRVGFQGCLGNIDLNGKIADISGRDNIISVGSVLGGCRGPIQSCTSTTCKNGGICLQQWNDFLCDCSMTTYVGKTCQNHVSTLIPGAAAYRFGDNPGLLIYRWMDNFPSSRDDSFALGFSTTQRNALLLRVTGSTIDNTHDYLELKINEGKITFKLLASDNQHFIRRANNQLLLSSSCNHTGHRFPIEQMDCGTQSYVAVNGRVTLRFNIGSATDVVLDEPSTVSDGQYHNCIVSRTWMNATITVDNKPDRNYIQEGQTRSVFNSQSTILIGGMVDLNLLDGNRNSQFERTPTITQAFRGQMVGFFYNDVRVFDLAAKNDPQVEIIGDVNLIRRPSPLPPTTPTISRPISTIATLTTTTKSTSIVDDNNINGCDDEDLAPCPNSSGSGEGSGEALIDDEITLVHKRHKASGIDSVLNKSKARNTDELSTDKPLYEFLVDIGFIAQTPATTTERQHGQKKIKFVDEPAETAFVKAVVTPSGRSQSDMTSAIRSDTTSREESDWQKIVSMFEHDYIFTEEDETGIVKNELQTSSGLDNKSSKTMTAKVNTMTEAAITSLKNDVNDLGRTIRVQDADTRLDSNTIASVSISSSPDHIDSFRVSKTETPVGSWGNARDRETATRGAVAATMSRNVSKSDTEIDSDRETSLNSGSDTASLEVSSTRIASNSFTTPRPLHIFSPPLKPNLNPIHAFGSNEPRHNVTVAGNNVNKEQGISIKASETPEQPQIKSKQEVKSPSLSFNPATTNSPDVPSLFTETNISSIPIMIGEASSLSMSMIIGIAVAAFICMIVLIFIVHRCRTRDAVYNVTKQERCNGITQNNGKHITITTNGKVIEKKKVSNHVPDKEVFV